MKNNDEINLIEYFKILLKRKKMILLISILAPFLALFCSYFMANQHRSTVVIIPNTSPDSGLGSIMSQMGGLPFGGLEGLGGKSKLTPLLKSRSLAEKVVERFDLKPILFPERWNSTQNSWNDKNEPSTVSAAGRLLRRTNVSENSRFKTIYVSVVLENPNDAARVANGYVEELQEFVNNDLFSVAKKNRIFIEHQLELNKVRFLEAGKELNRLYAIYGFSDVRSNADVDISEDVIQDLVNGESHPDKLDRKLATLQIEGRELEKKIKKSYVVKDVPQQIYLEHLMLRRETIGKLNALLSQQYQLAKIKESKDELSFQVLDHAIPQGGIYKPRRIFIFFFTFAAAFMGAVFLAYFLEYLERLKKNQIS